jgi:hypothetical protein
VEDPIRRRLLVRRGSDAFGLEEGVLLEALQKRATPRGVERSKGGSGSERLSREGDTPRSAGEGGAEGAPGGGSEAPRRSLSAEALDPAERELAARALTEEGALQAIAQAGGISCFATPELMELIRPWVDAGQPPLPEERDALVEREPLLRGILAVHPVGEAVPLEEQRRTARSLIERLEERRLRTAIQALDRAIREAETTRDGSLDRLVAERRDLASKLHQRSQQTVS